MIEASGGARFNRLPADIGPAGITSPRGTAFDYVKPSLNLRLQSYPPVEYSNATHQVDDQGDYQNGPEYAADVHVDLHYSSYAVIRA